MIFVNVLQKVTHRVMEIINEKEKNICDISVGDVVRNTFDQIMENDVEPMVVISNTKLIKKTKRKKDKRPDNWKEIIEHYQTWGNHPRITIKEYALDITKGVDYWTKSFSRWSKDVKNNKEISYSGRCSIIGPEIDEELASIVREYNKHGILMTNRILRCALIGLLKTHNRNDLLERIISEKDENDVKNSRLRFGKEWCYRFYKRHKISNRRGITKIILYSYFNIIHIYLLY